MRANLTAFFEDVDIFGGKRGAAGGAGGFVVLLDKVGEMERASQAGGAGADDQDVGLKSFALCGHRFISLAEHTVAGGAAPATRAFCIDVKGKGLREKGFVIV